MPSGENIYVIGVHPKNFPLQKSSPLLWSEFLADEMLSVIESNQKYLIYFLARPEDVV